MPVRANITELLPNRHREAEYGTDVTGVAVRFEAEDGIYYLMYETCFEEKSKSIFGESPLPNDRSPEMCYSIGLHNCDSISVISFERKSICAHLLVRIEH
jgi:hypothetical protein